MRKEMQLVHEYLADEGALRTGIDKHKYKALLINQVTEERLICLSSSFNHSLIKKRMIMMTKSNFNQKAKLKILTLIPLSIFLFLVAAYADGQSNNDLANNVASVDESQIETIESNSLIVGEIYWKGNTVFSSKELIAASGLKKGKKYSGEQIKEHIWNNKEGIATLYFDKGYVFFNIKINEDRKKNGSVDISLSVYEGVPGKIGQIILSGNVKVSDKEILNKIVIKPGDWFSKTKIVKSIEALCGTGKFVNDKITPVPIPVPGKGTSEYAIVDLEFKLVEK
jgi:hypothetical protein